MVYQLESAIWELTLKCNLHCAHCGSAAGKARENELTTDEAYHLCESLKGLGCKTVCLMGGEAFLRSDWYHIAQCIRDLNMDLTFVSNGLLVPQVIDKLRELSPNVVGISLDGFKTEHERIRGKNTFHRTMKAIQQLYDNKIPTTIITTVSQMNYSRIYEMRDRLIPNTADWQIQVAMPIGNFSSSGIISKEQYYQLCKYIYKMNRKRNLGQGVVAFGHGLGYFSHKMKKMFDWDGCDAGISSIGITSDGNIVGCLSLGNDRFFEGNVRDQSLSEIWNGKNAFKYTRQFHPSEVGPNCKGCEKISQCKGGCSASSYDITNQFHNAPYCIRRIEEEMKYHEA